MPSASKLLGDLVSSAGAISVTSGVANTAITGTITTAQIADNAITTDKVAAGAIVTADIADGNVTDSKLANTAVAVGTYGGSSNSALITVDSKGRITAVSNVAASGYSGPQGLQVFNTPGTFTLPPGITSVRVQVAGGGGGGGNGQNNGEGGNTIGSPGGSGGVGIKLITGLTGPVAVTVGNAGNGGSPVNIGAAGNPGNASSFGPHITSNGGSGGPAAQFSFTVGTPGNSTDNSGFAIISPQGGGGGTGNGSSTVGGAGSAGRVIVEY